MLEKKEKKAAAGSREQCRAAQLSPPCLSALRPLKSAVSFLYGPTAKAFLGRTRYSAQPFFFLLLEIAANIRADIAAEVIKVI